MPSTSCPYAGDMPGRQNISNAYAAEHLQSAERHLRFATARLGLRLSSGATILDFGCGIGTSVQVLLGQGYNAFGVDVLEYWGRDFDKYWHIAEKPPAEVAARLKFVDPTNYRLPFEDGTFDFCSVITSLNIFLIIDSNVRNYARAETSGIWVHNFPGPNNLMEGHVGLPFPWLCFTRWYLTLCAWLRVICGIDSDWRLKVRSYTEIMRFNNYPTKARLRSIARSIGAEIRLQRQRSSCSEEAGAPLRCLNTSTRSIWIDWQPKSRDLCFFSDI